MKINYNVWWVFSKGWVPCDLVSPIWWEMISKKCLLPQMLTLTLIIWVSSQLQEDLKASNMVQIPRNTGRRSLQRLCSVRCSQSLVTSSWNLTIITMKDILRRASVVCNKLGKKSRGRWRVRTCLGWWGAGDVAHPVQGIRGPFPSSEHFVHVSRPAPSTSEGLWFSGNHHHYLQLSRASDRKVSASWWGASR